MRQRRDVVEIDARVFDYAMMGLVGSQAKILLFLESVGASVTPVKMSASRLAKATGLTRRHVQIVCSRMRERGLLHVKRAETQLGDPDSNRLSILLDSIPETEKPPVDAPTAESKMPQVPRAARPGRAGSALRNRVFSRDGWACVYCGRTVQELPDGEALTADHIVPVADGGPTVEGNLVACCTRCNSTKGKKPILEALSRAEGFRNCLPRP